jgi:hypothetical protein
MKLETSLTSKYYAIYIAQFFTGNKKYISSSKIANNIRLHIQKELEKTEYESLILHITELYNKDELYKLLYDYKYRIINNWNDIIKLYCILAVICEISTNLKDNKIDKLIDNLIELCCSNNAVQWITNNGGWEKYLLEHNLSLETSSNSSLFLSLTGISIFTSIIGLSAYIYIKK